VSGRLLFNTYVLIWAPDSSMRLDSVARTLLQDTANDVLFSGPSIWGVAIKANLGRADFALRPEAVFRPRATPGFLSFLSAPPPRGSNPAVAPRDPFDWLLIAQALAGLLWLLTADPQLQPYSGLVALISR